MVACLSLVIAPLMPQSDRNSQRENKPRGNEPSFNWRGVILIAVAFGFFALAMLFWRGNYQQREDVPYNRFLELLENKQIVNDKNSPLSLFVEEGKPTQELRGKYVRQGTGGEQNTQVPFSTTIYLNFTSNLQDKLTAAGIQPAIRSESHPWTQVFASFAPVLLLLLLLYFLFRQQIRMAGTGALNFGKSKARMLARDKNKITFEDVAGVEEAKDEVQELVEFLRDPKKFQKLGGRIPKGVLLVGPPGTGKTLLARAIAGEADVPFFSISGSDFVEMFVGVGASRVRDMFEQGKKSAPCIIFIDEIDAVGRHRGHGVGGGHDEREQTLNALLVEMDGFDTQEGVIIIAATNRPDVLDPALLRPGRFDRQITVNLPDVKGREAILKVHSKNVKLDPAVDLAVIARGTPGYSGAELANLLNEAALLAARTNKKAVGMVELEEGRDKVRWGRERRSLAMTDEDKKFTAWHEAGHALVNVMLKHTHPLHKVTIIPRGQALGSTMYLPKDDILNRRRKEMLDIIAVTMAGRIAEEIVSDDISSGATGDIQQATQMARAMVTQWGMSDKLGMVQYGDHNEYVFLGREMTRGKDYSERTAQDIDNEVKRIIDEAYKVARTIIDKYRDKLEVIANCLLEYETLEGSQVEEIIQTGKFTQ